MSSSVKGDSEFEFLKDFANPDKSVNNFSSGVIGLFFKIFSSSPVSGFFVVASIFTPLLFK